METRPEAKNLVGIYAALANKSTEEICTEFEGAQFSRFKDDLADLTVSALEPITHEMSSLLKDPAHVEKILFDGASRANDLAAPILDEIRDIMGFLRP